MKNHLATHIDHHYMKNDSTLHVIRVVSNPVRYNSRYRLAREQEAKLLANPYIKLYTVETAFGDHEFEIAHSKEARHLQLKTNCEAWIKENMINLAVKHLLPRDWLYMAWIDADIEFEHDGTENKFNWAWDTIQQLQRWHVVQPFQNAINLGPKGQVLKVWDSVGYKSVKGFDWSNFDGTPYKMGHTGYAWSCTRFAYENMPGGLLQIGILGAGDHHMAMAFLGKVSNSIRAKALPEYSRICEEWQQWVLKFTHGFIGYTKGFIKHNHHGAMSKRYYIERWKILTDNKYNPDSDLMYDRQGLLFITGKPVLEQQIKLYNEARQEDSTESD